MILSWSENAGIELPPERLDRLLELIAWAAPSAARLGLTKYDSPVHYTLNLVLPSLALAEIAPEAAYEGPGLDFGAGAGAVGLCWAVLRPEMQTVLADRRARVVQFLDLCLRRFGVSNGRASLLDLSTPPGEAVDRYGLVWVRAYAPGPEALKQARQWLRPGGWIALWHQPPTPEPPADLKLWKTTATTVDSLDLTVYHCPDITDSPAH
jgi:16S rRNA G527 N7-methylase RsmG